MQAQKQIGYLVVLLMQDQRVFTINYIVSFHVNSLRVGTDHCPVVSHDVYILM